MGEGRWIVWLPVLLAVVVMWWIVLTDDAGGKGEQTRTAVAPAVALTGPGATPCGEVPGEEDEGESPEEAAEDAEEERKLTEEGYYP